MSRLEELNKRMRKWSNSKAITVLAILLIMVGTGAILSAIIFPIYTKLHNEAMIREIRKSAESTPVTEEPMAIEEVGEETADVTEESPDTALTEQENSQVQKEKTANEILQSQDLVGIIEIEKINIKYAIVEGTENVNIRGAVGHMTTTAKIGETGNCVIAGHRGGIYGEFFENIDKLELEDIIMLTDTNGKEYLYSVYEIKIIAPGDWSVTEPLGENQTITLLSCVDNAKKRIAVSAVLFSS